jgi:hypothetical protein
LRSHPFSLRLGTALSVIGTLVMIGAAPIVGASAPADAATSFQLQNFMGAPSGMCLGIKGGGTDQPAVLWPCNGARDQQWHWGTELNNTGFYQLINGDGMCLGVASGGDSNGDQIVGWTCNGHIDQYWEWGDLLYTCDYNTGNGSIEYTPFTDYGARVAGVQGGHNTEGTPIVLWYPISSTCGNQFWEYSSVENV